MTDDNININNAPDNGAIDEPTTDEQVVVSAEDTINNEFNTRINELTLANKKLSEQNVSLAAQVWRLKEAVESAQ